MPRSAIRCIARNFEINKEWTKAAEQYEQVNMPQEVARCIARGFETKQQWQEAAEQWLDAAEQYEQVKMPQEVARCIARSFEIKQQWQEAAEQYELARMPEDAARLYKKAAKQYRLARMPEDAARCSAKAFENKKEWLDAAKQYTQARMPEDAARLYEKAAEQYRKIRKLQDAARLYEKAAEQYRKIRKLQDAARCKAQEFEIKKQWQKAAEQYTQARMLQDAARCRAKDFENKRQWQEAAEQYKRAGIAEKAAKLFEKAEQEEKSKQAMSGEKIGYKTIADVNATMSKVETINALVDLSPFKSNSIWGDREVEMSRLERILPTFDNIIGNQEYSKKCQILIDNKDKGDKDLYTMCFWHLHAFAWCIKKNSHEDDFRASDFLRSQVGKLCRMAKENDNYENFLFGLNNYVRIANEYTNNGAIILCDLRSETGFMIPDWIEH